MPFLTLQDSEPTRADVAKDRAEVIAMVRAPKGHPMRKQFLVVHDADLDSAPKAPKVAKMRTLNPETYAEMLGDWRSRDRADVWDSVLSSVKFGKKPKDARIAKLVHAVLEDLEYPEEDSSDEEEDADVTQIGAHIGPLPSPATFEVLPALNEKQRHVTIVAGASGSGKSTWVSQHCLRWAQLWPDRKIFLISKLKEDEVLDKLPGSARPNRILIDSLVEDPIKDACEMFANSLVIADDVDSLTGKDKVAVAAILNDLVTMGRHQNISVIVVLHLFAQGKETSRYHLEANRVVLFPHGLPFQQMFYAVKKLWGLDEKTVRGFLKLGRWVCLSRTHPQWLVSETSARTLTE